MTVTVERMASHHSERYYSVATSFVDRVNTLKSLSHHRVADGYLSICYC
jgi:hypothetical protein